MATSDTERLRLIAHNPRTPINTRGAMLDAATEIERLRAAIAAACDSICAGGLYAKEHAALREALTPNSNSTTP